MSLNPDTLLKNFDIGRAAGLRGAQFRQEQREKLSKENLIALDEAAQVGEKLGMFSKDSENALVMGDNFLLDGPEADEVRKTFFNNTAIGKTIKFKNKDGSINQAKLNNFMMYSAELVGSGSSQRAPRSYDKIANPLPFPELDEPEELEDIDDELDF